MKNEPKTKRKKSTNAAIAVCVILAILALVLLIFVFLEMRKSLGWDSEEPSTSGQEVTEAPTTETKATTVITEAPTTETPTTEVPTTEEPTTEALPDGTIYEIPTPAGDGYLFNGQIFNPCCAGHSTGDYYAKMVNTVGSSMPSGVRLYDILAPTAFGACLSTSVQQEMVGADQPELIEYINSQVDESKATTVPAYKNIIRHNAEYIYFNADHHWTQLGAYYAYETWCEKKGIESHPLSWFKEKYEFDGYLGSFFKLAGSPSYLEDNPDTVVAYVPNGTNSEVFTDRSGDEYAWHVVQDVSDWARTSKYNCFIGGDNPYTVIENPEITDGSACMLVKESYGNAFAPFLVDHYQYVYVIDYRYYEGNLVSMIVNKKIQDVIILNNIEAIGGGRCDTIMSLFAR